MYMCVRVCMCAKLAYTVAHFNLKRHYHSLSTSSCARIDYFTDRPLTGHSFKNAEMWACRNWPIANDVVFYRGQLRTWANCVDAAHSNVLQAVCAWQTTHADATTRRLNAIAKMMRVARCVCVVYASVHNGAISCS